MEDPTLITSSALLGVSIGFFIFMLAAVSIWSLVWKGWALWIAAKNGHKAWFIALLVVNTLGILEIIYIFAIGKKELEKKSLPRSSP